MRFTFRLKVILLLTTALLSLALMIAGSELIAAGLRSEIDHVQARLVPRAELALKLEASFVDLTRSLQDAVSAQDMDGLTAAEANRDRVLQQIENAGAALEKADAAALRLAVEEYFAVARRVSEMLINGGAGEDTLPAIAEMQVKQEAAERVIRKSTSVGRGEIDQAFADLKTATLRSRSFRMVTGAVAVFLMLSLWLWASRQMLRSLTSLSAGLQKFATGNFEQPIVVSSRDELGDLTRDANAMASNLQRLANDRDYSEWIQSGQVDLSLALRGNQTLDEIARNAVFILVQRVNAVAAAIYLKSDSGRFERVGGYADARGSRAAKTHDAPPSFADGEGLLGQVALEGELRVVRDPPEGFFDITSALGNGPPRGLVLYPLRFASETIAVVELALFDELSERGREFLHSVEDALVVALQAARARKNVDRLLTETREQADRLAQQEEELRLSNQELSDQQEELRVTNVELEEKQVALEERNVDLDRARAREQDKAEELSRVSLYKSQFLANMSHELRTPLNSMLLLSHLLTENASGNLTPKQVEHCSTIHSAGQELLELINQVLDLAKIEAGKQELELTEVPLQPLIERLRRMFEPLAQEKGLDFSAALAPQCPAEVRTDRNRLERILVNLLGNAVKFTEKGGVELSVALASPDNLVDRQGPKLEGVIAFVVSDTGIGIPEAELSRVFSPFEQVEATSARRYEGSGLGLAIAKESAHLLGGELLATSTPNRGSVFTCYLPSTLPETRTRSELRLSEREPSATSVRPGRALILIIEDDSLLAEQLVEVIEERGFTAMVAERGETGLMLAEECQPQGIVLDVKLPDIDGWTVMERLKSSSTTRGIPVHFLSALDAPRDGLERGAVGYLTKPATREQLRKLIETLASPGPTRGSRILVVEDSVVEGQSIVALLESEDFEADHVTSAEAALAALERQTYMCIVLDLGLEEMDGLELLERLRRRSEFLGTGVVIHTGRSLTSKETSRLQAYTQAIVMKDGSSSTRLIEEIRLFIHHVRGSSVSAESEASIGRQTFPGRRLLVVEDDMRTVYSLSALLQSRGCEVLVAENGREALELLAEEAPVSCILLDIMMPEMDGYETLRRLRSTAEYRKLPVIVLTAKAMAGERERCLEAGADEYLSKPVDSELLFCALERRLKGVEVSDAS